MRSILLCLWLALAAWPAAAAPDPAADLATAAASLSGTVTDAERTMAGAVNARSHALIVQWLRANPHRALTLHLDSNGGQAVFGAKLFDAIAAQGRVATDVEAGHVCLSACAYLWLAGSSRTVAERAVLGFHSAYCTAQCDLRGVGLVNQSLLDILARVEPGLAVLISNTGVMISGRSALALASRESGHWALRVYQPPS